MREQVAMKHSSRKAGGAQRALNLLGIFHKFNWEDWKSKFSYIQDKQPQIGLVSAAPEHNESTIRQQKQTPGFIHLAS